MLQLTLKINDLFPHKLKSLSVQMLDCLTGSDSRSQNPKKTSGRNDETLFIIISDPFLKLNILRTQRHFV